MTIGGLMLPKLPFQRILCPVKVLIPQLSSPLGWIIQAVGSFRIQDLLVGVMLKDWLVQNHGCALQQFFHLEVTVVQ